MDNQDNNKLKLPDIEEFAVLDKETYDKLSPLDQKYYQVQRAITFISAMNKIDSEINRIMLQVHSIVPATRDELKIIIARMSDIKPSEIKNLSLGFMKQLFTIEGKEIGVNMPDTGTVKEPEFYREVIRFFKASDEQVAAAQVWVDGLRDKFNKDIPEDVKTIISTFENMDNYMHSYFNAKLEDPNVSPEEKESVSNTLKYTDYGKTLDPLYDSLKAFIEHKGSRSILHGYRTQGQLVATLKKAIKVCKENQITFPIQLLEHIEKKLFGEEKYKNYDNFFLYLLSRHIKFKADSITHYDRVFISQAFSNLVTVMRESEEHPCKKLSDTMKESISRVIDMVIEHD